MFHIKTTTIHSPWFMLDNFESFDRATEELYSYLTTSFWNYRILGTGDDFREGMWSNTRRISLTIEYI